MHLVCCANRRHLFAIRSHGCVNLFPASTEASGN
jgi:hypothetical protein